jgi:hypothetical protein
MFNEALPISGITFSLATMAALARAKALHPREPS